MRKKIMDKVLILLKGEQTAEVSLSGVTPANLFDLLEKQGYTNDPIESNGWEHDFSVIFRKPGEVSLCYSGSWFGGYSSIGVLVDCQDDICDKETDDEMVRRLTNYPSMQAMIDASNETKRGIAGLHKRICG